MKEFKSFFKTVNGNEGTLCHYSTRLDTYGCGCNNNCGYCYAKSLLDFRGLWNPVEPGIADINKIKKVIEKKLKPGDIVRLGGMTDCFQKFEQDNHITYETIKLLNERGVHYLIVTKNADLISSDEYVDVLDKKLAHIQISITNTDEELGKRIEPGAPSYIEKIKGVEKLQSLGFDVAVRLSPYIPSFVNIDIINNIKCDKILIEFLRVNTWIKKWLTNLNAPIDLSEYSLRSNGYYHLPLEKKKELLRKITGFKEITVCEDVDEHWKYWKENVNHNQNDCCNINYIY